MKYSLVITTILMISAMLITLTANSSDFKELTREKYIDKCKGAWLGQMIGVTYGEKYEFRFNGVPILEPLEEWKPESLERAFAQDDLYVEMTFLEAIEKHGINISFEQAGKTFAESKYPLWHANKAGRENVRKGIMPPLSGHPRFNPHADDIDFQIESDLFGIITPGLFEEMQQLGEVFGSIMNYGDGLYAGYFIAGMYSSAFFIDDNIEEVVHAGLSCIPPESNYRKCIEDVITSYRQHPDDWFETWKFIEHKWQDDIDCEPGNLVNIDARINGAYVAIGLLYGKGDLQKTLEITTRCGQDADCNPSSAAGILCCMKGFSNLEPMWKEHLPKVSENKFIFTNYSWNTLIDACVRVTEQIITKTGGTIENDIYKIPLQNPTPPPTLEQWVYKHKIFLPPILKEDVAKWNQNWKVKSCKKSEETGIFANKFNRDIVLMIAPPEEGVPAMIEYFGEIPSNSKQLQMEFYSIQNKHFSLRVRVDYVPIYEQKVQDSQWTQVPVDISKWAGAKHTITVEILPIENTNIPTVCLGNINFQ